MQAMASSSYRRARGAAALLPVRLLLILALLVLLACTMGAYGGRPAAFNPASWTAHQKAAAYEVAMTAAHVTAEKVREWPAKVQEFGGR